MVREDGIKTWGAIGNILGNTLGTWWAFYPILWEQIGNRPQKKKEFAPTHPPQKRKSKKLSPPECGGFHFEFWQFPLRRR
jgi:hypothetical protein